MSNRVTGIWLKQNELIDQRNRVDFPLRIGYSLRQLRTEQRDLGLAPPFSCSCRAKPLESRTDGASPGRDCRSAKSRTRHRPAERDGVDVRCLVSKPGRSRAIRDSPKPERTEAAISRATTSEATHGVNARPFRSRHVGRYIQRRAWRRSLSANDSAASAS